MKDVLLLNADWSPIGILGWQRAVCVMLAGKVDLVVAQPNRLVRSPSCSVPWPSVVALRRYVALRHQVKLTRRTVLARDGYKCQYCGVSPLTRSGRPKTELLSVDHVVPRAQAIGGAVRLDSGLKVAVSSWENLATACHDCNGTKRDRTPTQANMVLARVPRRPTPREALRMTFEGIVVPEAWAPYVPESFGLRA